jgi:hypothetical protein
MSVDISIPVSTQMQVSEIPAVVEVSAPAAEVAPVLAGGASAVVETPAPLAGGAIPVSETPISGGSDLTDLSAGASRSMSRSRSRMTRRKPCKKGYTRSRETGRCRNASTRARRLRQQVNDYMDENVRIRNQQLYPLLNAEELGKIDVGGVARGDFLGPLRPGGMYGGGVTGGNVTDGNVTGGKKKRSLTKYNMFVKSFKDKNKSLKGKSFIRSAARAWNACKRKGTSKCQNKSRSRSRSRSRM